MNIKIFKAILLFAVFVNIVNCQSVPKPPCPSIFRYYYDGSQWIGVIRLPSNSRDSVYKLTVSMTISASLSSRYIGTLDLFGDRNEVMRRIASGGSIGYKVIFPTQSVLPVITSIILNGNEYCRGQAPFSGTMTSITLNHILYSERVSPLIGQNEYVTEGFDFTNLDGDNTFSTTDRSEPSQNQNVDVSTDNSAYEYTTKPIKNQNPINNANQHNYESNPFLHSMSTSKIPNNKLPSNGYSENSETTSRPVENYECGVSKKVSNALIVGGDTISRGEWPWITAIFMKKVASLQFICSGSLISHKHIVTAAHCVVQKRKQVSNEDLVLKFGCHNIQDWADSNVKTMEAEEVVVHPDFDKATLLKNDIAVLKVSEVEYTEYIIPVCLWAGDVDLDSIVGESGTVIGWGRDENGLMATPEPRLTKVPIVSTDTCRATREEFFRLTSDTTLCAGGRDGTGPCNGDSGGGLYLSRYGKWSLRGIVSNSLKDTETNSCNLNEYVVFTDASKYTPWIKNITNL